MSVDDLCKIFNCSQEKVKRMARKGDLPAFKFGKAWHFFEEDVERFLRAAVNSRCHLRRDQEH